MATNGSTSGRGGAGRWVAVLFLAAVVVLAVAYYRVAFGGVTALVDALDHCPDLFCDFTRQYYPTGRDILTTGQPSRGYLYSSFFALLLAPFGRPELPAAVQWWAVFQLVGILLLLLPAIDFYRESPVAFVLYVALLAFSMPLLHNLKWGQVSPLVTGCVFAALFLYRRQRAGWAAVVLAFAVAVKYYVAVAAFYFLLRREWRFLAIFAVATLLFWLVLPVVILGPETNWQFYVTVRERMAHVLTARIPSDINAQYLPSVVGRWLGAEDGVAVWRIPGYALFLLNLAAVARLVLRGRDRAAEWAVALLLLSLPFIIETSWPHYFVFLPFVQTLAWLELRGVDGGSAVRRPWSVVYWGLWLTSVVLASMPFFQLVGRWQDYSKVGVIFIANLCLFVLAHLLTWRRAGESRRWAPAAPPAAEPR